MMKRNAKRIKLCVFLLVLNLAFIWGNSCLPASVSGAISQRLSDFLAALLGGASGPASEGHHLLRKLAHFLEFSLLGIWLTWLCGMLGRKKPDIFGLPLLCGLVAACCDETIQLFVDGRGSSLIDVWIDTAGVVLGICLVLVVFSMKQKRRFT